LTFGLSKGELICQNNFIGGLWVPATNGAQFAVTNPATGEVIANVANSGPEDARAATNAAARAFPMWRDALPKERAAVLRRWHALILEHANSLGELISLEQGKPLAEGRA
jgi:succinate-semialdehyde dehydrogenase/glutarate-semialdehyde dehydrogenase